jgi:YrhK-like protein
MRLVARLNWWLDVHRWGIAASNILAAALFVAGSIGFFWPTRYVLSVTLFLAGSLLFLFSASAAALLTHGPAPRGRHAVASESRRLRIPGDDSRNSTRAA